MRSKSSIAFVSLASTLLVPTGGSARPTTQGAATFTVPLSGEAEVSISGGTAGDRDGSGRVKLTLDSEHRQLCYSFTLKKLATPLMAHIHKGPAPGNGPSVITLFTGPGGHLSDCVTWTEKRLAEIASNPSNFYVNLSTTEYPDGALRGQLAA